MHAKSLYLLGFMSLATAALPGQPTNGPVYWSTNRNAGGALRSAWGRLGGRRY